MEAGPRPATTDDVRSLRRWLIVAGVWAMAATAIAIIALVVANRADDDEDLARTSGRVAQVRRDLNQRLDELEQRIGELATSEDVSNLDTRLKRLEDDAGQASDRVERLSGRVDDLQSQVEALEQAGTETTETTETTP
jgi:predicted nuclease with TOPRIM domain